MKNFSTLQNKVILIQKYLIKQITNPEIKNIYIESLNLIESKKWTQRQCKMMWHDLLDSYELADTRIEDSKHLQEIDRLLIENFGEGEGLAPEKWKMNRKIRAILKRGIRDANEARMIDEYISQLSDDKEIKKAEIRLMEFEEKIKTSMQKDSISSKGDYSFLSKYRMEISDDTPAAQKLDRMLENFRKKKND